MRLPALFCVVVLAAAGCSDEPQIDTPAPTSESELTFNFDGLELRIELNRTVLATASARTDASWTLLYLPFADTTQEYDIKYQLNSSLSTGVSFWWCPALSSRNDAGLVVMGADPIVHEAEEPVAFEESLVGFVADGVTGLACLIASQNPVNWNIIIESASAIDVDAIHVAQGVASITLREGLTSGLLVPNVTNFGEAIAPGWTHLQFMDQGTGLSLRRYRVEYPDGVLQMGAGASSPGPVGLRAFEPAYFGRTDNVEGTTSVEVEGVEGEGFTIAFVHLASQQPFPAVLAGLYEQPS
jgi:hypothetical protein